MKILLPGAPADAAFAGWLRQPRLLGAALVLALAGVHHFADTPVQLWLRNAWFDAYQVMMPRARLSAPAVIVAVDEKSLARLGQWPWPRTLVAQVLDRLAEYRPRAVGVDVIFAEPDRHSPEAIAESNPHVGRALALELKRLTTNDETLAAAIRRLPVPVVSLGSGNTSDGVHIIGSDLFHLYEKHTPRHSKIYCDLVPIIEKGLTDYRDEVRSRVYPGKEHTVFMKDDELNKFKERVGWKK